MDVNLDMNDGIDVSGGVRKRLTVNTTDSAVRITHIQQQNCGKRQDEKSQPKTKKKGFKSSPYRALRAGTGKHDSDIGRKAFLESENGDRSGIRTYNFPQEEGLPDHTG